MTTTSRRSRQRGWFRHPWHLVRCADCHKMILSSASRCPNCAAWRPGARVFSIGLGASMGLTAISVLFLGYLNFERHASEAREQAIFLQWQAMERNHTEQPRKER